MDADEAGLVRFIYRRFMQLRSVVELVRELSAGGYRTKMRKTRKGEEVPGRPWDKSAVYRLLKNPVYIGLVRHKENTYPGEHEAIIDRTLWDEVQRTNKNGYEACPVRTVPRGVKASTAAVADNPAVQKPLAVALARAHRPVPTKPQQF